MKTLAQKWDSEKKEYEKYDIPKDWYTPLVVYCMETTINCASCGKELNYGDSYTSRIIHTPAGFGYNVCESCYNKEEK